MKLRIAILIFLILYLFSTSFQCKKCHAPDLLLDEKRNWLPPRGMSQLNVLDENYNTVNFRLRVKDTAEIATNQDCGNSFIYEYKTATLYFNTSMTDSIYFSLSSDGWMCVHAISNGNPCISMCNVFGETKEGVFAKKLFNYPVGTHIYQELILLPHGPILSNNIDSVFLANNVGIVGFKYLNKKYFLQ